MHYFLANEEATLALGKQLAEACPDRLCIIHLEGELGAGKTTLTRGFLRAMGHQGNVKSPTYTLVEHYQLGKRAVFHFDLYRLSDAGELEFLGLDDYFRDNAICLLEWAQRGSEYLPEPDLLVQLDYHEHARNAVIEAKSVLGEQICGKLHK
ncbi:tRNA (adenosine(37)-N6)-threonylcarbamoyltransferase complex ATPase subunit type 1 TsaE [Methylophaga thiooxydans]|uniref:tRNA (adenosine(37)-N6)-threonylcarbamoyltransferase complex ATPase subunit type 1 TsaE n=1 Tax=Methylophaga thiooxydans TaxID=392484 RepID=UPI0023548384|nr:tRNA (adenosine(37)-N6)-threonylcarbamoyltransferase complex ATPase subunit type 1 TsaE [Methylophaga thiooxydans]